MSCTPQKISFMFEVAERCNQRCTFCYNAWRPEGAPGKKQLSTAQALKVLERVIDESPCHSIALSGGEPLLRKDIFDLISFIKKKGKKASLVTNGLLLSKKNIDRCLSAGVDAFQITLLSHQAERHNRMTGVDGFGGVFDAIHGVKRAGGKVQVSFVALAGNIEDFKGVLELSVLVGVDSVSFGRFLPGGAGLAGWQELLPSPEAIERALETAEEFGRKYRVAISVTNPLPPCLHDISKYRHVRFGFCGVGREDHALLAIDPEGNLKLCSHSPVVLGNLLEKPFAEIIENPFLEEFDRAVPDFCRDCAELAACRGGCRSSAQVCYGSVGCQDPYVALWKTRARKPTHSLAEQLGMRCEELP